MQYEIEKSLYEMMQTGGNARCIINDMILKELIKSPKQAWRTLEKWCDIGIYEYGTTLDMGWLVDKKIIFSEIRLG